MRNTAAAPVIDVRNISRVYGKQGINWMTGMRRRPSLKDAEAGRAALAVDKLSFQVYEGEVYGLLGTNGAGKTSSLELIEGLAEAQGGLIRILGMDPIKDREALRPQLGIMLQHGGLPQELTVRETMTMWAGTCSTPLPIDQVLADVELTHRLNNKVGSLSGGEKRRLDLACALLGNPRIVFLDEPTTGLDPESRRNTWRLLRRLKDQGVTMILTTHYLEEAEYLCDRIAIMHRGRKEVEGTLSDLVSRVPSSIVFDATSSLPPLSTLPVQGATIRNDGRTVEILTNDLQRHTLSVLQWAQAGGVELRGFAARPASLEALFMEISEK
ncbi:Daunorubicin/doxorubicin resistance ATP-binding protein DrrA [Corynebacterium urogenitale]|uniref:Daunorubicin/doxorubicin resistance ATP-binding protein DrrA n=1 Tax=Corynebacterium urogenitale TaxID=2487892 RepID=A0A5J6Z3M8_9CORY|nr:Daunorubicin/doxorubicin resistance ATP-binding protein DrrA [Corynebacterium urogenitale]